MASTNKTSNLNLSQFIDTDKPSWLTDYNNDMTSIDESVGALREQADAADTAVVALQETAETLSSDLGAVRTEVNATLLNKANWEWIYPVGSYYISAVATNPAELFGFGVWEHAAAGKMIVGVDETDMDFSEAEKGGGEKTHTLVISEMPNHGHELNGVASTAAGIYNMNVSVKSSNWSQYHLDGAPVSRAGGGQAHNNMPPYMTANIWKRTA